jgi:hypothetical protein
MQGTTVLAGHQERRVFWRNVGGRKAPADFSLLKERGEANQAPDARID